MRIQMDGLKLKSIVTSPNVYCVKSFAVLFGVRFSYYHRQTKCFSSVQKETERKKNDI